VRRARCDRLPRPARTGDATAIGRPSDRAGPAPLRRYARRPGRTAPGDPGRHGPLSTPPRDESDAGGTRCRRTPGGSGGDPMTTEGDPRTRIVMSWLREDAHEDAERVLLRALDEVDATSQRGRPWSGRRLADRNSFAKLAIAAAAVVVIALAGMQFLPRSGASGGQPSPTPPPTATPAFPQLTKGPLAPGRYALYDGLVTSIEVPAGWIGKPPFVRTIGADGAGLGWGPGPADAHIFARACKGPKLKHVGRRARCLVDALDAQVGSDATI